jgi:hypothetical protein
VEAGELRTVEEGGNVDASNQLLLLLNKLTMAGCYLILD